MEKVSLYLYELNLKQVLTPLFTILKFLVIVNLNAELGIWLSKPTSLGSPLPCIASLK